MSYDIDRKKSISISFNEFNKHLIIKHKRNLKRLEIYLFIQDLKYEQNVQKRKIKRFA